MIAQRPQIIANEVRLRRSRHKGVFLVVEGADDKQFCRRFLGPSSCQVVVAEGKAGVVEVIDILDRDGFSGALGIVDANLDRVEGHALASPNLVDTALHDLECLLLRSRALDLCLAEYGSEEKLHAFGRDVRDALLAAAEPIGYLRLHSVRSGLNLRFQGLRYHDFIDRASLAIELRAMAQEVINRSQRLDLRPEHLAEEARTLADEGHDRWSICCGDDLLGVLSVGLKHALGSHGAGAVSADHLRRALRLSFAEAEFLGSQLYQSMRDWETRNPGFRLMD